MEAKLKKQGFTLVELMMAMTLSLIIITALFAVYSWSAELGTLCGKKNRSQVAAINSSVRIMDCIRNASTMLVTNVGNVVNLTYPDGSVATLAYTNSPGTTNAGALGLFRDGLPTIWFVKSGITKIMTDGHNPPFFSESTNAVLTNTPPHKILYVKYRVSQPSEGGRALDQNDGQYAMHARFAVCLRNAPLTTP